METPNTVLTAKPDDTPFVKFWAALNEEFRNRHLPELTFGPAKVLWDDVARRGANRALADAMKAAS